MPRAHGEDVTGWISGSQYDPADEGKTRELSRLGKNESVSLSRKDVEAFPYQMLKNTSIIIDTELNSSLETFNG